MRTLLTSSAALLLLLARAAAAEEVVVLDPIVVQLPPGPDATLGAAGADRADLATRRATSGDGAELLRGVPGVTLSGAGGISSLPAIHGLADDRLRIQVDGADLMPACPNHMNSPLSYADPTRIESVTVFSGVTPVSVGGDSIGGAILVKSAPPEFATGAAPFLVRGLAGGFYRTNGNARGYNLGATAAGRWLNLTLSQSDSWAGDYEAGGRFKPATPGREGGAAIPGEVVGSSAYRGALRRSAALSLRGAGHLLQLEASQQTVGFEGFPNQRMDMTSNDNRLVTLRYTGQFAWGDLEARLTYQRTRHEMDMGPDRFSYGTGMPMLTRAKTRGALVRASLILSAAHLLRTGAEAQLHTLYDWWPPVGGSMGPNAFWNIDYGQRRKVDAFAEWEAGWTGAWTTLLGVRSDTVTTDAGPVEGYDNGLAGVWGDDAAAFNAARRRRTDANWDLTASARHAPGATQAYELGYARKTRSPNLYQRYPWSTNAMAALMNNFVGDGNGYVGRLDLRPETAHTVSLTGAWHDPARTRWDVKATGHYTHVEDYIDARRCDVGQCSAANAAASTGFVLLQYVNQPARLYGADLSGQALLADAGRAGSVTASGAVSFVRGDNLSTGDALYGIMPVNARLALVHRLGTWIGSAEVLAVGDKRRVSRVRNELPTGGYYLLNLRGSYGWAHARLDVGVENLLDRLYANPLGGAYVGQGASMSTTGIRWGTAVPGPGRSLSAAFSVFF